MKHANPLWALSHSAHEGQNNVLYCTVLYRTVTWPLLYCTEYGGQHADGGGQDALREHGVIREVEQTIRV